MKLINIKLYLNYYSIKYRSNLASSISDISSPVILPSGRNRRPEDDGYATKRDRKTAEHKAELYR